MPLDGARYRVKTTKSGKKVRLAFQGDEVVEAKNLKSGATHTPAEFKADRMKDSTKDKIRATRHYSQLMSTLKRRK